jgi:hypothetical protein
MHYVNKAHTQQLTCVYKSAHATADLEQNARSLSAGLIVPARPQRQGEHV